jgi:Nuclease-related domain/UvrD-like helicase C-terminal domain/Uncharacterized conserved protein (DUF2075)
MARLIPGFTDEHTPPGERDVFNLLAAGPDDWVALHSLDLAPWNRGLRTEIDFVVMVPDAGILCIEVKSQDNITFDGFRWSPESITRSPFKQAADGRHTFYRRLTKLAPQLKSVPVVHCCIFPRATFDILPNLSVQPWESMDMRAFGQFASGAAFCADLRERIRVSISTDLNLHPLRQPLTRDQVDEFIQICVPVQRRHPDMRDAIRHREQDLERILRNQQKPILLLAANNQRFVVSGGAGTGKTLIAMEVARRAAEAGRRVALLCYNQLVGRWMKERMERTPPALPNLLCGPAIRVMAEMTGVSIPDNPPPSFWESALPEQIEDCLTDPEFKTTAAVDYLVLDEAQDLLSRPSIWNCLVQFLKGGIVDGSFALFGDFEHQVLAKRAVMQETLESTYKSSHAVRWQLSENCRNYRIVGDTAVRLAGLGSQVYSDYMRSGGSLENYDIVFYQDDPEQLTRLGKLLREFKAQGYAPSDIVLLSFRADEQSAAKRLRETGYRFRPAWQAGNQVSYASIHAYKGMESKVVILTDMLLEDQQFNRDLFYTGMTRATESVRILCDERSKETLVAWLAARTPT